MKKLFIHGWASDASVWTPCRDALLAQGVEADDMVFLDHSHVVDFESLILATIRSYKKVQVIAWSLGGMVVLRHLADLSGHIERLSLIGVPAQFCNSDNFLLNQAQENIEKMKENLARNASLELRRFWRSVPAKRLKGFRPPVDISEVCLRAGLNYLQYYSVLPQKDVLKGLDLPVKVIQGAQDSICLPRNGPYLVEILGNATLVPLEELGHAPFLESPKRLLTECM